jgi:hypothetical protein
MPPMARKVDLRVTLEDGLDIGSHVSAVWLK